MHKIAILTCKGGTGKTTTTVNLGHGLALSGNKVIIFDCDSQGSLLKTFDIAAEFTLADLFNSGKASVTPVRKNLWVVASGGRRLAEVDMELSGRKENEFILCNALQDLSGCDYVLFDCPPTINLVTLNVLNTVDGVLIPVSTDFLAIHGVKHTLELLVDLKNKSVPGLKLIGLLPTFFDARTNLSKRVEETLRLKFKDKVLDTVVRINTALKEAPRFGQTIFEYDPASHGAEDYRRVTREILDITNGVKKSRNSRS